MGVTFDIIKARIKTYTDTLYNAIGTASGKIASSISDGDTTHAPDGNSVFDALAAKASTAVATTTTDGLQSATDKSKEDALATLLSISSGSVPIYAATGPPYGSLVASGISIDEAIAIIDKYTKLGGSSAPAIKKKKLTGTTGSSEGDTTGISHGLTSGKIIGITVLVWPDYSTGILPQWIHTNGYQYMVYITSTTISVILHATNSENILSKPITVLIEYEQ